MRKFVISILVATVVLLNTQVTAGEKSEVSKEINQNLKAALKLLSPDKEPDKISPSPVSGLVEVIIGPRVFYFSEDGRYMLNGHIIDILNQVDVTEPRLAAARKGALDDLDENDMIMFPSKDPKHTITVFTDADCGYCRKLHAQMDDYNKLGINVRYLLYPRTRIGSPSYKKSVSIWCSTDKKKTLTEAKNGKAVESKDCSNPIASNINFGRLLGVNGTPAIVQDNGEMIRGYMPPAQLFNKLEAEGS